jgi:hypothetical protein
MAVRKDRIDFAMNETKKIDLFLPPNGKEG